MTTSASAAASREHEVSALARGLAVLRAVADAEHPVSNRELAEATGIPKATVSRLAATLVSGGLLRQDAHSERFSLGSGLLELGNVFLRRFDLRSHARPRLAALAELAGTAVHLGVRDGLDVLVVDSLRASSALILSRIDVGSRMAIATSAAGRAYLSSLPPAEREALRAEIRAAAGRGWARVAKRLDAAQAEHDRAGYCSSFGEWHPHIHALGFALRGPRGERYAVSCGGPAYLLSPEHLLGEVAPAMLAARDEIEREVGATG